MGPFGFANGHPANSIVGFLKRQRKNLLLLGEKAGMGRELSLPLTFAGQELKCETHSQT
jgi:hypothetical protein